MNEFDQIDDYFGNRLPAGDRATFEQSLRTDPRLADAVAFYLLTKQTAQTDAHDARKAEWAALGKKQTPARTIGGRWVYMAAAACVVVLLGLGWYFLRPQPSATELAEQYITTELQDLPITMDAQADSLKKGAELYNAGNLTEAATIFNDLSLRDPGNALALKYAGIVSLRQGNYDEAIDQFHRLSLRTDLFANPGTFYEALTYLKRNRPGDLARARQLLQLVVEKKLEGEKVAEKWLKQL